MSDPGTDPDPDIEQVRTDLQHARADADADVSGLLDSLTVALGNLDASDDEPKQDNLESIRAELVRLADETDGETREYVLEAREEVREILKDRLAEDESSDEER